MAFSCARLLFFTSLIVWLAEPALASIGQRQDRPIVGLIATGGTISNNAGERLTAEQLAASIPDLDRYAIVETEQFSNIPSNALTQFHWLRLAHRINDFFSSRSDVSGIVVTSGTDTLEETAFFLHLTVKSELPVVVVGSMRPPDALSYDGIANLLQGFRVAAAPSSRNRGVLVVLNNEINSARDVTKTNAQRLHSFRPGVQGLMGIVDKDRIVYFRRPQHRNTHQSEFDVAKLRHLPRVDILLTYIDAPGGLLNAAIEGGAEGLIVAAAGAGSTTRSQTKAISDVVRAGYPVVVSSRTGGGRIVASKQPQSDTLRDSNAPRTSPLRIEAEDLAPVKARILLMLALTVTRDGNEIQRMFKEY